MKLRIVQLLLIAITFVLVQFPLGASTSSNHSGTDAVAWEIKKTKPRNPDEGGTGPDHSRDVNWNG